MAFIRQCIKMKVLETYYNPELDMLHLFANGKYYPPVPSCDELWLVASSDEEKIARIREARSPLCRIRPMWERLGLPCPEETR